MRARATVTAGSAMLLLAAAIGTAHAGPADPGGQPLRSVSPGDPYAACDIRGDGTGTNAPSTEVEPYVSVNPRDHRNAIGVFQQDRWSNGGARGLTASYTTDGTHFTETALPYTHCAPGGLPYQRASDVWVSFGPDGTAYSSGLVFDSTTPRNGVAAATSYDGGRTWHNTTQLIADNDPAIGDDKNSVTADPVHPGVAYQVWDRLDQVTTGPAAHFTGPAWISVTRDGGRTWSTARPFVDTTVTPNTQTIGNVIVVDRRTDTLYDFFTQITYADYTANTVTDSHFAVVTSHDQGATWSTPVKVAADTSVPEVDPNDPTKTLRAGGGLPSAAIDPHTGELYVAYEGSEFTGGHYDAIQLVHSTDAGRTWSGPQRVNQAPQAPAFTPTVAVDARGTVALTYYDLRYLTPGDTGTLPTAAWLVTLPRGGDPAYASERRITRVFDWLKAPDAGGHFLGDYAGLATTGETVRPILAETGDDPLDATDAYSGAFHPSPASSARTATASATPAARTATPAHPARPLRR